MISNNFDILTKYINTSERNYFIYLIFVGFLSILLSYFLRGPIRFLSSTFFRKIIAKENTFPYEKLVGPFQAFSALSLFLLANIIVDTNENTRTLFVITIKIAFFAAVTYFFYRLIDLLFEKAIIKHKLLRSRVGLIIPLGRRVAKTLLLVTATLSLLSQFGVDVSTLLVGLGVGSLAVALAAQKILENLFGGAVLSLDQPFQVGDYCRCGDILGYIEEIGVRSTRIRTLERTLVSVPNSNLSQMNIENYNEREKIRLLHNLRLELKTSPAQIKLCIAKIKELIVCSNNFYLENYRVRLISLDELGYVIEISAFAKTTEWADFLEIKEQLFLQILEYMQSLKVRLAIPERRMHQ